MNVFFEIIDDFYEQGCGLFVGRPKLFIRMQINN